MAIRQGGPIGRRLADVGPAPISYGQAMKSIHSELWNQAMIAELEGLNEKRCSKMLMFRRIGNRWTRIGASNERSSMMKGKWLEPMLDF